MDKHHPYRTLAKRLADLTDRGVLYVGPVFPRRDTDVYGVLAKASSRKGQVLAWCGLCRHFFGMTTETARFADACRREFKTVFCWPEIDLSLRIANGLEPMTPELNAMIELYTGDRPPTFDAVMFAIENRRAA